MTISDDLFNHGQKQLREVALRYANGHGLQPGSIEWEQQYDEWWLKVCTADRAVRVVFSREEIEDFARKGKGRMGRMSKSATPSPAWRCDSPPAGFNHQASREMSYWMLLGQAGNLANGCR